MNLSREQIEKLHVLCEMQGVKTKYKSSFGTEPEASPESLLMILRAFGVAVNDDLSNFDEVVREKTLEVWNMPVEPVVVFWEGKTQKLLMRFSSQLKPKAKVELTIRLENGKVLTLPVKPERLKATKKTVIDGVEYCEKFFVITKKMPIGYHELKVNVAGKKFKSQIISAPKKAYKFGNSRSLGSFAPLYAVHSEKSWGVGDFSDFRKLIDWAYGLGCDFVGTLPMLAAYLDKPMVEPSPYSPVSRIFWNEIYLDPRLAAEYKECAAARELVESDRFKNEVARLQSLKEVDYLGAYTLKREVLHLLADQFFAKGRDRSKEFKEFLKIQPNAVDYAEFRAVTDATNQEWPQWPERMKNGEILPSDYNEKDKRFHLYSQYLVHQQLTSLSNDALKKGKGIYVDYPLSCHAGGYDVWRERQSFVLGAAAGCPPDPNHVHGQNWGILPLNPKGLRTTGYRYVRACLENHMRYAGFLRLDHVMGFYRLFWVPQNKHAGEGVYVHYSVEEMFAILVLESVRNECELIGEDLGTVPPEIREAMERHGILRMFVQQRRLSNDKKNPFGEVPANSICSLNTHDMPPFAAWWQGMDIRDKLDLKYFGEAELPAKLQAREEQKAILVAYLNKLKLIKAKTVESVDLNDVLKAMLIMTAAGPAKVMQVNMEDLWLEVLMQNMPGTWKERPNWRRRHKFSLEQIADLPELRALKTLFKDFVKMRKGARKYK